MKRSIFFIVFLFLMLEVCAQIPQSFKYQAVVRDGSGAVLAEKPVLFRITILTGGATGNVVYRENHVSKTTNAFGLVNLEIGGGITESGSFSAITWGSDQHFLKVEFLPSGGVTWQDMGTSQLLSVPYALYAKDVQNRNDADADPVNEIQSLSLNGTSLLLSNGGGSITLPQDNWGNQVVRTDATLSGQGTGTNPLGVVNGDLEPLWTKIKNMPVGFADGIDNTNDADADTTNELQDLQLNGSVLGLTGSNKTVELASVTGDNWGKEVVRTDATLEGEGTVLKPLRVAAQSAITGQVMKWNGSSWKPGTDNFGDADNNPVNEIQTLSLTGSSLSISGGNKVELPADTWGSQVVKTNNTLTGLGTDSSPLAVVSQSVMPSWGNILNIPSAFSDGIDNVDDDDHDPLNELQSLTLSNNLLTLTKSGGTVVLPGDNWGNQTTVTDGTLSGNGTLTSPLRLAGQSATNGQVLKWSGTAWAPAPDETGNAQSIPSGPAGGDLFGNYPNPLVGFGAITSVKILDGTISAEDIANDAITSVKIADGAIQTTDLAGSSVTGEKIADGTISAADLGNASVTSLKIQDGTIGSSDLAASSVTEEKIAGQSVTTDKIGNGVVTSAKLADNSVIAEKISAGAVTGSKISGAGVIPGQILKWNGTLWAPANDEISVGSLVLPYAGNVVTSIPSFSIRNTGSGSALQGRAPSYGVIGTADSESELSFGVLGESYSVSGNGVYGLASALTGETNGVYGGSYSNAGVGVLGQSLSPAGSAAGVKGRSSSLSGTGVYGMVTALTGVNYGVYGNSSSSSGYGVFGEAPVYGLYGKATASDGRAAAGEALGANSIGLLGKALSENSTGVWGEGYSHGVYGVTPFAAGKGIYGEATSSSGPTVGVYGTARSMSGCGVYGEAPVVAIYGKSTAQGSRAIIGEASQINSMAVWGRASMAGSTGVQGEGTATGVTGITSASNGTGVKGEATSNSGTTYGVAGFSNSDTGYGIYGQAPYYGVYGRSTAFEGMAISGEATGEKGTGIKGKALNMNGIGVWGEGDGKGIFGKSSSAEGIGISGYAAYPTGENIGVNGEAVSASGYGVYGTAPKYGVFGIASRTEGRAVMGLATDTASIGIYGKALNTNSIGISAEGARYDFYANGPGVDYGTGSSLRWKKNINPIPDPLRMIRLVRGVYFDWDAAHGGKHDIGMIAEEVGKILPEIVVYEDNGVDAIGMDYSKMTPLLLEALKAQQSEIELLRNENTRLQSENDLHRTKLGMIESRLMKLENLIEITSRK